MTTAVLTARLDQQPPTGTGKSGTLANESPAGGNTHQQTEITESLIGIATARLIGHPPPKACCSERGRAALTTGGRP
jgi:hypothetical protein